MSPSDGKEDCHALKQDQRLPSSISHCLEASEAGSRCISRQEGQLYLGSHQSLSQCLSSWHKERRDNISDGKQINILTNGAPV